MEHGAAVAVEGTPRPESRPFPFRFVGSASEYFRIWLVNLALGLVTLGIYSAWATVRTRRWFYGSTWVGDASFAYLANPVSVLKGRLLAVAFLIGQSILSELHPVGAALTSIALFLLAPVLIARGLAFRARNSAYRNVRLRFTGTAGEAAKAYVLWSALSFMTLGLAYPAARWRQARFVIDNLHLGRTPFRLHAGSADFYRAWGPMVWYLVAAFAAWRLAPLAYDAVLGTENTLRYAAGFASFWLVIVAGFWRGRVATTNLIWSSARIGAHRLESRLGPWRLLGLYLVNTVAILGSVGLLIPWASVRTARYRASCTTLHADGSFDEFVAAEAADVSAAGDEAADLFDVDLGV